MRHNFYKPDSAALCFFIANLHSRLTDSIKLIELAVAELQTDCFKTGLSNFLHALSDFIVILRILCVEKQHHWCRYHIVLLLLIQ